MLFIKHSFWPRDVRNTQRTGKLQHYVSISCNSSSLNYDRYIADDILENDEALDKDMSDFEEEIDEWFISVKTTIIVHIKHF